MPPKPGATGLLRRHARTLAISIALLAGFGWILRAGALPLLPPAGTLNELAWPELAGFVLAMLLHLLLRFARVHFLLAPVAKISLRRLMTINAIAMALITMLPLRLGEISRPALLREKGRVSAWAVTGTVGAERILDGVLFSLLLLCGLALAQPHEPLPHHIGNLPIHAALIPKVGAMASIAFAVAFLMMLLFYFRRETARRLVGRLLGGVSPRLAERVTDIVGRLSDGLRFLINPRYALPYLAITLVAVLVHVWAIDWLASAVGIPELSFAESMVVVGVLALGFAVPNSPGFFGQIQLALYAGLASYVSPETVVTRGAALAFLFYVTYVGLVLGLAALAVAVEHASAPALVPEDARANEPVGG